jgi:hypothetical protein
MRIDIVAVEAIMHLPITSPSAFLRVRAVMGYVVLVLGCVMSPPVAGEQPLPAPQCHADGPLATVAELPEASGLAASRRVTGRLWAHNDSGQPILFALDTRGSVTGRLRLSGAAVEDWEAMAVGPCPAGSCLYVADIGDNDAERKRITIYRVEEPSGSEQSIAVKDVFHATYPDGAHDAETFLVTPNGDLFIVTKGDTGTVGLYRFPRELRVGATHQLERVGKPRGSGKPPENERITDGAVSADGQWVVLRTGHNLAFHRTRELIAGDWQQARSVDLKGVGEAQGEGVAIGAGGTVYLAGEGGGKSRPGTFARLKCSTNS